MMVLALWMSRKRLGGCHDLMGLVRSYQQTGDPRQVMTLLECVEGPQRRISLIMAKRIHSPTLREEFPNVLFLKVCEVLKKREISSNIRGYLLTMAKNEAINFSKAGQRPKETNLPEEDSPQPDLFSLIVPPAFDQELDRDRLMALLTNMLQDREWKALQKVYLEGMPRRDAAQQLEMTEPTLRGVIARAVKKIRRELAQHPTVLAVLPDSHRESQSHLPNHLT